MSQMSPNDLHRLGIPYAPVDGVEVLSDYGGRHSDLRLECRTCRFTITDADDITRTYEARYVVRAGVTPEKASDIEQTWGITEIDVIGEQEQIAERALCALAKLVGGLDAMRMRTMAAEMKRIAARAKPAA